MNKLLGFARTNAIALAALFIALGGTSYAAFSLPARSVGTKQLRNGAVTPAKLNGKDIAGSVAMWARISPSGTVVASKPRARTVGWSTVDAGGKISWGRGIPPGCFSLATVDGLGAQGFATVWTTNRSRPPAYVTVVTFNPGGQYADEPVNVAVICP